MTTTTRWMTTLAALSALPAGPVAAQDTVLSGVQIAEEVEALAATLHGRADRWTDAAALYEAAAELRPEGDVQAQRNLYLAANLHAQTGRVGDAIAALEAAGGRALSSGDSELAGQRFADAALVAQRAGLTREQQRLSYRVTEVALAAGLARAAAGAAAAGAAAAGAGVAAADPVGAVAGGR